MDDLAQRHHRDGTTEPGLVPGQHALTFVCEAEYQALGRGTPGPFNDFIECLNLCTWWMEERRLA